MDQWMTTLGMRTPIISAPMGGVAGGRLAVAVSAAGGLGMIGMGSAATLEALERELALVPSGARVGIGLVNWVVDRRPELLERALAARPALLTMNFGDDLSWIERARSASTPTAVQVWDATSIEAACDAGADLLVARGREGGGHGPPVHDRDVVLELALTRAAQPVLAAGGVGARADVDHVLGLGAAGVWVGTAFAACHEALSSPGERRALFAARADDTVTTSLFDRVAGYAWPPEIPERVIANDFLARWSRRDDIDLAQAARELKQAVAADDPEGRPVNAGLGVDHLVGPASAAEVVAALAPTRLAES